MWHTNPEGFRPPARFYPVRMGLLAILIASLGAGSFAPGQTDRALPDIVEEFRRALNVEASGNEGLNLKYANPRSGSLQVRLATEFREKNLLDIAARYLLTSRVIASLQGQGVPEGILAKLQPLKDKPFQSTEDFIAQLQKHLGKDELDQYQGLVTREAGQGRLRSLGDLSRILLLKDWPTLSSGEPIQEGRGQDDIKLDSNVRKILIQRFYKELKDALNSVEPLVLVAACDLINEASNNARQQELSQRDLRRILSDLVPQLIQLTGNNFPAPVRAASSFALGRVGAAASEVVPAFTKLMAGSNPVGLRLAGAKGAFDQVQYLVGQVTMPTGVDIRKEVGRLQPQLRDECREFSIDTIQAYMSVPDGGWNDPDPRVRLLCVNACLQIATFVNKEVRDNSQVSFPPEGRKLSREDIRFIESQKQSLERDLQFLRPVFKVFQEAAPELGRVILDPNEEIRHAANDAMEEISAARRRLRNELESIPKKLPKPEQEKERRDTRIGIPTAIPQRRLETVPVSGGLLKPVKYEAMQTGDELTAEDRVLEEPSASLDALIRSLLSSPDQRSRIGAVDAIETMMRQGVPAIPALIQALGDPSPFVRWASSRTLGRLAPASAEMVVPKLAAVLCDPDLDVRVSAATALERFGLFARAAIPELTKAAGPGDSEQRIAAMKALVAAGTDAVSAIPVITEALKADNFRVRKQAALTLGQFGTLARSAAPALREVFGDTNDEVRTAAADALIKVLGR